MSLPIKGEQGHRLLSVRLGGAFLLMCAKRHLRRCADHMGWVQRLLPLGTGWVALYLGRLLVSTSLAGLPPCLSAIGHPFPEWSQRGLGSPGHFQEQGQGQSNAG